MDLDGTDAAAKLVILGNWIMGMKVTLPDINCTELESYNWWYQKNTKNNCSVKLIASCNKELTVSPIEVSNEDHYV